MPINSRNKGNRAERVAADLFQKWANKPFSRTPSSGGLQWKSSHVKGDITCTKEGHYFPFCVEIKNHKDIDFNHLLVPKIKHCAILEFWTQCKRDADACDKIPLLLMRYNGLSKDFFFVVLEQSFLKTITALLPNKTMTLLTYHNLATNTELAILRSTGFFKSDYIAIKNLAKKFKKRNGSK